MVADEKRLVDANALMKLYKGWIPQIPEPEYEGDRRGIESAIAVLEDAPTVDAVEVVHGKWIIYDDGFGCEIMHCSVCNSEFYDGDNDTVDHPHNYCPNCGAKMDGKGCDGRNDTKPEAE